MNVSKAVSSSNWTREQDKTFETALAMYPENVYNRWEKIAGHLEGKTIEDLKTHYSVLLEDINRIESGYVPLPKYNSSSQGLAGRSGYYKESFNVSPFLKDEFNGGPKTFQSDLERRRGTPWTEAEHRQFLSGLEKYGKGDWRSISRKSVLTRTPTQVASHAQKYFKRLNSMNKERRRTSIHDITTPTSSNTNIYAPTSIMGLSYSPATRSFTTPGLGIYGRTAIGQPSRGPLGSAYGTQVNFSVNPIRYPMSYTSGHRQRSNYF